MKELGKVIYNDHNSDIIKQMIDEPSNSEMNKIFRQTLIAAIFMNIISIFLIYIIMLSNFDWIIMVVFSIWLPIVIVFDLAFLLVSYIRSMYGKINEMVIFERGYQFPFWGRIARKGSIFLLITDEDSYTSQDNQLRKLLKIPRYQIFRPVIRYISKKPIVWEEVFIMVGFTDIEGKRRFQMFDHSQFKKPQKVIGYLKNKENWIERR